MENSDEVKKEENENVTSNNETTNEYAYLDRGDFTSEKFKIEIRGLPKFYGISELKKLFKDKLKLDFTKIKSPKKGSPWIYVCFRNDDVRENALNALNGYDWKGKKLSASKAEAAPDPLVKKRKAKTEQHSDEKKVKLSQEEQLQQSTIPYFSHPYEKQLEMKQSEIRQVLLRLGNELWKNNPILRPIIEQQREKFDGLPCELLNIRSAKNLAGYRNKCEFTVGMDYETKLPTVGFRLGSYVDGFTGVAPIEHLVHIPERMKTAVKIYQNFIRQSKLRVFNPEFQSGEFKILTTRWSTTSDELMLIVGMQTKDMNNEDVSKLKQDLIEYFSKGEGVEANVSSLYFKVVQKRGPGEPLPQPEHLYGSVYITEKLLDLTFRISPDAFFQVNTEGAEILYSSAIELMNPDQESTVVDIYCGTGTIGLCFSKYCGQVLGLELIDDAVRDAQVNADVNKIENAEFFQGKAEDILSSIMRKSKFENIVAIVDPPRAGLHQKAVLQLRQTRKLTKLLFMACDPNHAIKNFIDLGRPPSKTLHNEPFVPIKAVAVDLFPHTRHCELIIYFERFSMDINEEKSTENKEALAVESSTISQGELLNE